MKTFGLLAIMVTKQDIESGKVKVMVTIKIESTGKDWPIGSENLMFRRTTDRYARKGTISSNRGYLSVKRNLRTGRFAKI